MKITLFIDSRGQVVRTTTEPWSESEDVVEQQQLHTVPSPPQLVLNEEQKRFFTKAKAKGTGAHPVWSKLNQ